MIHDYKVGEARLGVAVGKIRSNVQVDTPSGTFDGISENGYGCLELTGSLKLGGRHGEIVVGAGKDFYFDCESPKESKRGFLRWKANF